MMISPEAYLEGELQGKPPAVLMQRVNALRREIARLKRKMEHPFYTPLGDPSEDVRLSCTRAYLARAKQALVAAGGACPQTAVERRDEVFNAGLADIERIELSIGGFLDGYGFHTVCLEDPVRYEHGSSPFLQSEEKLTETGAPVSRAEFLALLADLHIGEWRRSYDCSQYGICIEDGTQWRVTVTYRDGRRPFVREGSNAYPHNFKAFRALMGGVE